MKPISIQLYSVRDQMSNGNHLAVLQQIADLGYKGVEGYGYGMTPSEFRRVVEDMGMVVSSYFGGVPTADTVQEFIDTACALGVKHTVSGFWIPDFESLDAIKRTAETLNAVLPAIHQAGLYFCLHNHWMEFERLNGRLKIEHLLDLVPTLDLELDVYWCTNFKANRAEEMVTRFRDRIRLLHVKDGPQVQGVPHVAVGNGTLDIPATLKAADPDRVAWHIVELDECATDMMEAVGQSYRYLVGSGLAEGNRPV